MTERERILQKIKRVQALAERGVAGERESAAATLDRLMKQHGISEAEIEEDRREIAWFRFKTPLEQRLLGQVIYAVTGRDAYGCVGTYTKRTRKQLGAECTAAERLEIELSFEFYKSAMEEELERFIRAFVNKNEIFPTADKAKAQKAPPLPMEEAIKLSFMMNGMDTHTRRDALKGGERT